MVIRSNVLELYASAENPVSIGVGTGDDLYYKSSPDVSSTSKDGTLSSGQSLIISAPTWIVSAGRSYAQVIDRKGSPPPQTEATVDSTDVGYDLVILAGQSNMVGAAGAPDVVRYDPLDVRIYQFPAYGANINTIIAAADPLGHPSGASALGPGLIIARWYVGAIPPNRRVLLVPVAWGGTGFVGTDTPGRTWKIDNAGTIPDQALYRSALTQARAALAAAGHNSRYAAIFWHQGEADSNVTASATYQANLDALIDAFRSDLGVSDLPFVCGQLAPDEFVSLPYKKVVDDILIDTPRRKTRTGFGYGISGHASGSHYDATGIRALARNMFEGWVRATENTFGLAPPSVSGLVLTQSSTTLNAAWDQSARVTDYGAQYKLSSANSWTTSTRISPSLDVADSFTGLTLGASYDVRVRSINEQGASAWATETFVMVTIPAQVTGVTLGTATGTRQPLTWNATTGATSYLVEYKKHSDSTWLTGATATTPTATIAPLLPSTSYDYRVSAINAAGTGTASATSTGSTAVLDPPIDAVGVSAARGYSSRKMRAAYAGSAMKVRRSSDNTEQDIGFDGTGAFDTAALATFIGSDSAFIKTLYDQSGNGLDLTQATTANQPRIANAGVLDVENSLATMIFDGTNDIFTDSSPGMYAAGHASILAVWKIISNAVSVRVLGESRAAATSQYYPENLTSSQVGKLVALLITNDAGTTLGGRTGTILVNDQIHQTSSVDTGAFFSKYVDGALSDTSANGGYTRVDPTTLDRFNIGGSVGSGVAGLWTSMHMSEVMIFNVALTTVQRQSGEINQKTYFSTP